MRRRHFLTSVAVLGGDMATGLAAADDEHAVKQVITDYYDLYFRRFDVAKYRTLLADDYVLLENGEIMDAAQDIAGMPKPGDGYVRTDAFEFRAVHIRGNTAYVVYFLRSHVVEQTKGASNPEWLESAVLRRMSPGWRIAVLHSTRLAAKA